MTHVEISLNGRVVSVLADVTLAAALLDAGEVALRHSIRGKPRAPLCGMGVCFECAVTGAGVPHQRACMLTVRPGMQVVTGA